MVLRPLPQPSPMVGHWLLQLPPPRSMAAQPLLLQQPDPEALLVELPNPALQEDPAHVKALRPRQLGLRHPMQTMGDRLLIQWVAPPMAVGPPMGLHQPPLLQDPPMGPHQPPRPQDPPMGHQWLIPLAWPQRICRMIQTMKSHFPPTTGLDPLALALDTRLLEQLVAAALLRPAKLLLLAKPNQRQKLISILLDPPLQLLLALHMDPQ